MGLSDNSKVTQRFEKLIKDNYMSAGIDVAFFSTQKGFRNPIDIFKKIQQLTSGQVPLNNVMIKRKLEDSVVIPSHLSLIARLPKGGRIRGV